MEGEYRKIGNKWEREQNVEDHDDGDNTGENMEKEGKTINGGFSNGEKARRKRALKAGMYPSGEAPACIVVVQ